MNDGSNGRRHLPGAVPAEQTTAYRIGYALSYLTISFAGGGLAVWLLQDGLFDLLAKDRSFWDALQVFGAATALRFLWMRRTST